MAAHMGGQTELSWDTPIQQLLPNFSLAYSDASFNSRLTLGDLYAHRSGLPEHAGDMLEDLGYTRGEILRRLRFAALHPYGQYDYTNFGLTAAAQAMSQAQGQDWADLCASSLYQAIGMQRSSSRFSDFAAQQNRAWGHIQKDVDYASYGASPATYLVQELPRQPDAQSPAGGVSSCAQDLALWMMLVLAGGQWQGRQIINAAALQATLQARPGGNYGYGFNIGTDPYGHASFSHSGAFILGAATAFILWPQAQLGIAVLTNAQPRGLAEALALSFGQYAWGEIPQDGSAKDWLAAMQEKMRNLYRPQGQFAKQTAPSAPIPAQNLHAYVGSYANDYWGTAQIALQPSGSGQALELRLGATPVPYLLQHWDGDTFTFAPQGESFAPNSVSALQFSAGQMQIELLKEDLAQGVFRRV
jgi:CubicO group peptidase (beta-lactamase class C family)